MIIEFYTTAEELRKIRYTSSVKVQIKGWVKDSLHRSPNAICPVSISVDKIYSITDTGEITVIYNKNIFLD